MAAAGRAADLDQVGRFATLAVAVKKVAAAGRGGEPVPDAVWLELAEAVGPGPLAALVEGLAH